MGKDINVIRYKDLPLGGFAGVIEKQMLMNTDLWPHSKKRGLSSGLGDLIYLSMGYFKANDGTPLHPHTDVDIVSFIYSGEIGHKGTLGEGTTIKGPGVQVQRAGTGMRHAEFSITNEKAELAQIWFRPPKKGLKPDYKSFSIDGIGLTTVYGGENDSFDSNMTCKLGFLEAGTEINIKNRFVAVLFEGSAQANGVEISEKDLVEGKNLNFISSTKVGLILIQKNL